MGRGTERLPSAAGVVPRIRGLRRKVSQLSRPSQGRDSLISRPMHLKSIQPGKALILLWSAVPDSRAKVGMIWTLGLGLGGVGFVASLALPLTGVAALWLIAAGLGLLLVLRGEPLLRVPRAEEPPEPPPSPVPPPLLDMIPLADGEFRRGSAPATDAQVREYTDEWADFLGKPRDETEPQVRGWLEREQPAHRVRVFPFLMARVPVTRGQWRAVMPQAPEEWESPGDDDALPATHVEWFQALAFCNALSEREGLVPCYREVSEGRWHWEREVDGYRLPTEAEWEYACRAGGDARWFWGDGPEGADAHAWYRTNARGRLQAVGGKAANPWGLHDMAGLVFEWCWDRFGAYPEDGKGPWVDPSGPSEGESRVVRGGSFLNPPVDLRSAARAVVRPDGRAGDLGLRCVRSRARQP
jgi:sulfatase modifying factor 1